MKSEFVTLLICAALLGVGIFIYMRTSRRVTRDSFLVAEWRVPLLTGAVTVAATWTQAPALLFSGQQAYQSAMHFMAFWIPNVAALFVAALLVVRIRQRLPHGYTVPQFMGAVFDDRVRWLAFILSFATLVLAVAYTLTGMRLWLSPQLGLPTWMIAALLGIAAFAWVLPRGLPAAISGDIVKIALVGAGTIGVIALWLYWIGYEHPISAHSRDIKIGSSLVLWTLGVPLAASLIGGPICNCDLGERFFALDQRVTVSAYLIAACLFGGIVLVFGSLGVLVRIAGIETGGSLAAFTILTATLPQSWIIVATLGLAVVLATALASFVASAGNLLTVELFGRVRPKASQAETILMSRLVMAIPIIFGTLIASQDHVDIGTLLRALAVIRGELIVPIIVAAFWPGRIASSHILAGMLTGLVGGTLLTYSAVLLQWIGVQAPFLSEHGAPLGAIVAVGSPLCACAFGSRKYIAA